MGIIYFTTDINMREGRRIGGMRRKLLLHLFEDQDSMKTGYHLITMCCSFAPIRALSTLD